MNMRRLVVGTFAAVCLLASIYLLCLSVVEQSGAQLDNQDLARNLGRASAAIDQLSSDLHSRAMNWADQDDGTADVAERNRAFLRSNRSVDIVAALDARGAIWDAMSTDLRNGIVPPPSVRLLEALGIEKPLGTPPEPDTGFEGIVPLPSSPMLVAVVPLSNPRRPASRLRWLVVGRCLSPLVLKQLRDLTHIDMQAWPLGAADIPEDGRAALRDSGSQPTLIRDIDGRTAAGYTLLYDTKKRPALLLRVIQPRAAAAEAAGDLGARLPMVAASTLGFVALLLLALERFGPTRARGFDRRAVRRGENRPALSEYDSPKCAECPVAEEAMTVIQATLEERDRNLREVEERLRVCKATRDEATYDTLTDLPNRRFFMDHLRAICSKSRRRDEPMALVVIGVDNLSTVVERLGREAGDELIMAVAERLMDYARPGDTVGRIGNHEFTVLLKKVISGEDAVGVTRRMMSALDGSISVAGHEIFASTSAGIAVRTDGSGSPETLMRNAATAMSEAKVTGTSGVVLFNSRMGDHEQRDIELAEGLRFAIERNELSVTYQPLIHLDSSRICGAEALVRWNHPTLGTILPGKFIPIAEESGDIIAIGNWVMETACRQLATWQRRHLEFGGFTMSVNLSGKQLEAPDVVETVRKVLERSGVDPTCVKFEITESVAMADTEAVVNRLDALRALGPQIAIDDFGTGYSSMASLQAFPLNTLKIDRAFVSRLHAHGAVASKIIRAIVTLSNALHLDVTAEGVETLHQATELRNLGCDIGQGYFYARPLTPAALEIFFSDWRVPDQGEKGAREGALLDVGRSHRTSGAEAYFVPPQGPRSEE